MRKQGAGEDEGDEGEELIPNLLERLRQRQGYFGKAQYKSVQVPNPQCTTVKEMR